MGPTARTMAPVPVIQRGQACPPSLFQHPRSESNKPSVVGDTHSHDTIRTEIRSLQSITDTVRRDLQSLQTSVHVDIKRLQPSMETEQRAHRDQVATMLKLVQSERSDVRAILAMMQLERETHHTETAKMIELIQQEQADRRQDVAEMINLVARSMDRQQARKVPGSPDRCELDQLSIL